MGFVEGMTQIDMLRKPLVNLISKTVYKMVWLLIALFFVLKS